MQNKQFSHHVEELSLKEFITLLPSNLAKQLMEVIPANDSYSGDKQSYQIVGVTPYYRVIKKGGFGLSKPYTRRPFVLTESDLIAIELYQSKLAAIVDECPQSVWGTLVRNHPSKHLSYKEREALIEHVIINTCINLGDGEVTLAAVNQVVHQSAQSYEKIRAML